MEERGQSNSTGQHKLILQNRKSGSFTGVTDVVNFDANEIILFPKPAGPAEKRSGN